MKTGDQIATAIFRVMIGFIGLTVLSLSVHYGLWKNAHAFFTLAAFCGLLLGYAFGGDYWGARLFSVFTGHHVPIQKPLEPVSSVEDSPDQP